MTTRRRRHWAHTFVIGVLVLVGLGLTTPPSGSQSAQALASIRDRSVTADTRHAEFKSATAVAAKSPALATARRGDTVVKSRRLIEPRFMAAVIRRPRGPRIRYRIPPIPPAASTFAFLDRHLERAADRGASRIVFPRAASIEIDRAAPLRLSGLRDVVVDLNGSTIRLSEQAVAFRIDDSERVVLRNGRIEGVGHLASIAEVSLDRSGRPHFELLAEYRRLVDASESGPPALHTVGLADRLAGGGWGLQPDGYTELFTNRGASSNNYRYDSGAYVPTSPVSDAMAFRDGDLVWLLHENNTAPAILLDNEEGLEDVTLENLTLANIPGMGIIGEVRRGLHIDGVRLEVADDPLAVFATSSDGIHINANGGDIVIENSYLGPNADDKITIKGNYWRVAAIDRASATIVVEPAGRETSVRRWGFARQRLVFVDDRFAVEARSTLAADSREDDDRHVLRLARVPAGVTRGMLVANVDNSGGRVVIRNNRLESTRAQGVLVQTQHVIVEDNTFDAIAGPPIRLNMGLTEWFEGVNTDNVLIVDNVFRRSAGSLGETGALIELRQTDATGSRVRIIGNVRIAENVSRRRGVPQPSIDLIREIARLRQRGDLMGEL